jgi:transcriptional regulator with XRE-family HTH domain
MSDRQKIISKLITDRGFRADYIRAKLEVLIPSQLRALRLREHKTQSEVAQLADMKQARISAMESPGRVNFNLETLVRMAATHNTGLMVKFVPFSEMLAWENSYSQDSFDATRLSTDIRFLEPATTSIRRRVRRRRTSARRAITSVRRTMQLSMATSGAGGISQLNLQFEAPMLPPAQQRVAEVIAIPRRERRAIEEPAFLSTAAVGAGRSYV